jgi:cytochrome c oxidase cbb3-type subunit 3
MSKHSEVDDVTGVETTGHVWDGDLKELNKPLPRWWLYTFYVCILWAIGYQIAYPAWPMLNSYTKGMLGYSQREAAMRGVQEIRDSQAAYRSEIEKSDFATIRSKPELLRFATASGAATFAANCAACHGRGAQGFTGYPNLNDDDWLWGGKIEDIHKTISFGVRSEHKDTRSTEMPKFGIDKILESAQISDAAEYVLSLSGQSKDAAAAERGSKIFAEQCTACHGEKGTGNQELGAPNLTDAIWLYGGRKGDIEQSITTGRGGKMPAWSLRLDPSTIKSVALYVHSLGGGK